LFLARETPILAGKKMPSLCEIDCAMQSDP